MDATLSEWYVVKAAGLFGGVAAIALMALARRRGDHPFARFGPANQVTMVRALAVALAAALIGEAKDDRLAALAVLLAVLAAGLDGADGWLARRTGLASAFGARFDMEVDALLILTLSLLVWQYGKAGVWVLASGALRYLFVAAGLALPWMRAPLAPTMRARIICVAQVVTLIVALTPAVPPPVSSSVAAAGLTALAYSFLIDVGRLRQGATS